MYMYIYIYIYIYIHIIYVVPRKCLRARVEKAPGARAAGAGEGDILIVIY